MVTLLVNCHNCEQAHIAEFSHKSDSFGKDFIYAVVCTKDNLVDYYTQEVVYGRFTN